MNLNEIENILYKNGVSTNAVMAIDMAVKHALECSEFAEKDEVMYKVLFDLTKNNKT